MDLLFLQTMSNENSFSKLCELIKQFQGGTPVPTEDKTADLEKPEARKQTMHKEVNISIVINQ